MRDRGISGYVDEVPNRRPHLTLADYSNLDEAEFMDMFDRFYNARAGFSLNFGMLGTFIGSGTLFLAPNPAAELLKFHAEHHQYFSRYADEANSLYAPNAWVPHCTIASRLDERKLPEALLYCTGSIQTFIAEIREVSLIKLKYLNNRCTDCAAMLTKPLI